MILPVFICKFSFYNKCWTLSPSHTSGKSPINSHCTLQTGGQTWLSCWFYYFAVSTEQNISRTRTMEEDRMMVSRNWTQGLCLMVLVNTRGFRVTPRLSWWTWETWWWSTGVLLKLVMDGVTVAEKLVRSLQEENAGNQYIPQEVLFTREDLNHLLISDQKAGVIDL